MGPLEHEDRLAQTALFTQSTRLLKDVIATWKACRKVSNTSCLLLVHGSYVCICSEITAIDFA